MPLLWRVFAAYALVAAVAVGLLILAPVSVSVPTKRNEIIVLLAGLAGMLIVSFLLLRRTLAPLRELTETMRDIDPLTPGRRISLDEADGEVAVLAEAFNEMLARLETERRGSARRAVAAQEEERRRIARELHDEIGQTLAGVMLEIESLVREAPPALRPRLQHLRETTRHSAGEVRTIARGLRPEALDDLGLQSALVTLARSCSHDGPLIVEHRLDPSIALTPEEELVVYRIAQEALANVVLHAGATRADVELARAGGAVELRVRDDGVGPGGVAGTSGAGIMGMRERALLVRGELTVRAASPQGTEVRLRLPPHGSAL